MTGFRVPDDLSFNTGLIEDPAAFARDRRAASWLFLCGEAFASSEGGISFAQVRAAVATPVNIVADPPVEYDLAKLEEVVDAIGSLARPAVVTCRTGPRSSAAVYVYAARAAGATADEVLAVADAQGAPFAASPPLRDLVTAALRDGAAD